MEIRNTDRKYNTAWLEREVEKKVMSGNTLLKKTKQQQMQSMFGK